MSQSSKRFSLKVLKAKNESNNWMYAPGQNASLMDATLKVAGTDVASCCAVKSWSSEDGTENAEQQHTGYELVAVLPKPDGGNEISPLICLPADSRRILEAEQCWAIFQR